MFPIISLILLLFISIPFLYLLTLLLASIPVKMPLLQSEHTPTTRFIILIPAHDEEKVIKTTISRILSVNYPHHLFSILVIADHCSDSTATIASQAGAMVYERNENPRSGKGAAISWAIHRFEDLSFDAVIIFDADTLVDKEFLLIMDQRIQRGDKVIQGQHIISNPNDGWFPSLTWAMFLIDNRIQNMGRSNLGFSSKNMGDSICLRKDTLLTYGWGEGLTEDYQLRQRLLLEGVKILYEPRAKGYGEAAFSWHQARAQRVRWIKGNQDASRRLASQLLQKGASHLDAAMLDGALQAFLPSYSTLTLYCAFGLLVHLVFRTNSLLSTILTFLWVTILGILFIFPFIGLLLERAPSEAYKVILTGPLFILWRSFLALSSRFSRKSITWVRTEHGDQK